LKATVNIQEEEEEDWKEEEKPMPEVKPNLSLIKKKFTSIQKPKENHKIKNVKQGSRV